MMCALAFAGKQTRQWVYDRTDKEGIRFGDALEAIGYIGDAPLGKPLDSYFELHIEQGPQLWETGTKVGIVAGGFPSRGWRVHVHGQNAHAGPTPMAQRSNAIMGASYLSVAVNDIGWRFDPEAGKAGVIRLAPEPNIGGIIPAFAEMLVDMRHPTPAGVTAMAEAFEAAIPRAARDSRTRIEIQESWGFGEFSFDGDLIEHLRAAAGQLGYPTMDLHSQAGHDAYHIADVAPTAMIFTPCDEGLTHTFRESTRLEDQVPGVEVLLNAVAARAA
jgi:N-carbamoyl-L-amino-acid hydrolase